jgi:hypothetical protein
MTRRMQAFISHISEESEVAEALKKRLHRDFLGLLDVYVSSDGESIWAGDDWVKSIEEALQNAALLVVLCSPESIGRPWLNFETGIAWTLKKPIVPICHRGLTPRDLPIPLSLKQGIRMDDWQGIRRLYARVADALSSEIPSANFEEIAMELSRLAITPTSGSTAMIKLADDRGIWDRLRRALNHPEYEWRSLERIAIEAGVSDEVAADSLRGKEEVRFSKGRGGKIIVGLKSRVGER